MDATIQRINTLEKEWRELQPVKPEYKQVLDKKFRLEFNYNSNHLEGNTLTYGETALLLFFDETKGDHTLREYEEMKAHDVAYKMVEAWATDMSTPLTEAFIKNLNDIILVRPFWKEAITPDGQATRREIKVGDYKEYPNSVRLPNGEIFAYASPSDTPIRMGELVQWYREQEENKLLHPVELAALFHYKFVCIHPFDDGNGRISRLLMNYVLLRNNLPPVVIKSAAKTNYLRALHEADTGNENAFINYVGEELIWSLEISVKAAKGESIEEEDDLDKRIELLKSELSVHKVATISRNAAVVAQLIQGSVFNLFRTLEEKCEKLVPLFMKYDRVITFFGNEKKVTADKKIDWRSLKDAEFKTSADGDADLKSIDFIYTLGGFKSNLNHPYFTISVTVEFLEFAYEIRGDNMNKQKFSYDKQLSSIEIAGMVKQIIEPLLESIEKIGKG
jgi:Fic family protein